MNGFKKEKSWIYRLKIPFDTVYTSVFLIRSAFGYILPSLEKMWLSLSEIYSLILTHRHSKHAFGGKEVEHCICECKKIHKGSLKAI